MKKLSIVLASPRGFCAGVSRAIEIVELSLKKFGSPVYVRHEIVHNRYVVDSLKEKGAIFVEELDEVPSDRPVIFSAHGVPKSVPEAAENRQMIYIDATCPLVSKVHREVERHYLGGFHTLLIGHKGHPEIIGTMGQVPNNAITLVQNVEDVHSLHSFENVKLAYATQTTLSIDETKEIIDALHHKFPNIKSPHKEDICYATTNRQNAVKALAPHVDRLIVVGSPNSSNSRRLVDVAKQNGCNEALLLLKHEEIDWQWLSKATKVGITAGASAPEILVENIIEACKERFDVDVSEIIVTQENIHFNVPRILREEENNL